MKTDFQASGNHFLPFFTHNSQLVPVEADFSSTGTYFSANPSFPLAKRSFLSTRDSIFLFQVFFLLMENITEFWGKANFKDESYSR